MNDDVRQPFRAQCRGPNCGKMVEYHVIRWQWRPKAKRYDPRWHGFNVVTDIGTGSTRTNGVSHHKTCVDADKFGGSDAAQGFPPRPVPRPPPPIDKEQVAQSRLF